ncbi:MAG TPA: tetratricopeptide repeat protein [Ktedonobacterales bacterium]|jgi:tetratricopeptide (TPR) repeat protein
MAQATPARTKAFISYSHKDKEHLEELQEHLKFLQHRGLMDVFWADTEIKPGDVWRQQIQEAIASARVALFLVSPAFFASEFIQGQELPPLLEAARAHQTLVLSVILQPSLFEYSDLADYQTVNNPGKPLAALPLVERNTVWVQVVKSVMEALQRPLRQSDPSPAAPPPASQKTREQWLAEGNAHWKARRYAEALTAFEETLRQDPASAFAWSGKGNALRDLKRPQEALAAYEEALRLDAASVFAWNGKGNALCDLKRFDDALAAYEQALRLDSRSVFAWNGKGNALRDLNRYVDAVAAYEQALRLDPKSTFASKGKAQALERLNQP